MTRTPDLNPGWLPGGSGGTIPPHPSLTGRHRRHRPKQSTRAPRKEMEKEKRLDKRGTGSRLPQRERNIMPPNIKLVSPSRSHPPRGSHGSSSRAAGGHADLWIPWRFRFPPPEPRCGNPRRTGQGGVRGAKPINLRAAKNPSHKRNTRSGEDAPPSPPTRTAVAGEGHGNVRALR